MAKELKIIRVLIILIVSCLVFSFYFFSYLLKTTPAVLLKYLLAQASPAVGVQIKVPENPYNTLAQQLKEKEITLQEREKILAQKEALITSTVFSLIGFLFVLIILNFYFDWRHRKIAASIKKGGTL